jgi:hypothetical protein
MPYCPTCGAFAEPDPETGYDGEDFCSLECADQFEEMEDYQTYYKGHEYAHVGDEEEDEWRNQEDT